MPGARLTGCLVHQTNAAPPSAALLFSALANHSDSGDWQTVTEIAEKRQARRNFVGPGQFATASVSDSPATLEIMA